MGGGDGVIAPLCRFWRERLAGRLDQPQRLDPVEVEDQVALRLYGWRTGSVEKREAAMRARPEARQDLHRGPGRIREEHAAVVSSDHARLSARSARR